MTDYDTEMQNRYPITLFDFNKPKVANRSGLRDWLDDTAWDLQVKYAHINDIFLNEKEFRFAVNQLFDRYRGCGDTDHILDFRYCGTLGNIGVHKTTKPPHAILSVTDTLETVDTEGNIHGVQSMPRLVLVLLKPALVSIAE